MIGRAGKNGDGAIELFGEHDPHQFMRPDRIAKGEHQVRPGKDRMVMAISAANAEYSVSHAFIAPLLERSGELASRHGFAALIEKHKAGIARQARSQCLAFLAFGFQRAIIDFRFAQRAET